LALSQIYADEGRSGKKAENRPGLLDAIRETCRTNGALGVYSLSRLARSTRDAIDIAERLSESQADLVSITEKIDTTTGMGRFSFTTIAALAHLERDKISERTTMALAPKRGRNERVSGHIPYGYRLTMDGVQLVEDPFEQKVIHHVHCLREQSYGTRQIGRQLDRIGLHPRQGWHWHLKVVMDVCRRKIDIRP
jgi:site-specific DNA recombinase